MVRWIASLCLCFALPASAAPGRAAAWISILDRHAEVDVSVVLGEQDGGLLALTGEVVRQHGEPRSGMELTWLGSTGQRRSPEPALELLGGDRSADGRLALVTVDGALLVGVPGDLRSLPMADRYVSQARWDPAGEKLAVTAWPPGVRPWDTHRARTQDELSASVDSDIFVVDAEGSDPRRLTAGSKQDYNPVWSPDGDELLFISLRTGYASYFLASVDDGRAHQLTNTGAERGAPAVPVSLSDRCQWDRVADRIVYETRTHDGLPQVWILTPHGTATLVGSYDTLFAPGDGTAVLLDEAGWSSLDLGEGRLSREVRP